jgi:hypothetical protein
MDENVPGSTGMTEQNAAQDMVDFFTTIPRQRKSMPQIIKARLRILFVTLDVTTFVLLGIDSTLGLIASLVFGFRQPWSFVNAVVFVSALPILGPASMVETNSDCPAVDTVLFALDS